MMSLTHAAIAACGVSFALGDTSPMVMGLAILGSQLPDLDTSTSLIGQIAFPVSRWIEKRYPHRTITHSFLATGAIAVFSLPLFYLGWKVWLSLWLGHLVACFSDTFTKKGVQLFYPAPAWCVCGRNPYKRLTTGGTGEYWVLAGAIGLLVLNLHLTTTGGLVRSASMALGVKEEVLQVYNQESSQKHVYARISGVWSHDRSKADGRYFIIGTEGNELIVTDWKGIYRTDRDIIASKISAEIGDASSTQVLTLTFSDVDPLPQLIKLQLEHSGSVISLSGQLTIDMPEDVQIITQAHHFATLTKSGSTLNFTYHPLEQTILQLQGQFATGTLTAKLITPRPR
jgi:inner membrane protein